MVVRQQVVAAAVDRAVPVAVRPGHPHRGVQHRGAVGLEVAEHHAQEVGVPGVARVDEGDVRAARLPEGGVAGSRGTAPRHGHGHHARLERGDPGQHGGGVVGRAVVDHDELPPAVRLGLDRVDDGAQPWPVVAHRQDHADQRLVPGRGQGTGVGLGLWSLPRTSWRQPDVVQLRPPLGGLEGRPA